MSRLMLIIACVAVLAGCAAHERAHEIIAPPVITQGVWQHVDVDLILASQDATQQAEAYARGSMEHWRTRVYEQTDEQFLPWYNSYWTQEWLSIKVGWYRLSAHGASDPEAQRLALYLQDEYQRRVLTPVALEIDPEAIMEQAAQFYVDLMGKQAQAIAQQYAVPVDQFNRHLQSIAAITQAPPAEHNASLYQLLQAQPLSKQPAYQALIARTHAAAPPAGSPDAGISSMAQQTSRSLEAQFTGRGVAGAVAMAVGRVAGAMISVGVAGVRAMTHESDRPNTDAHIRKSLGDAFDHAWLKLMNSPGTGVMALVYSLSGQIEGSLEVTVKGPTASNL